MTGPVSCTLSHMVRWLTSVIAAVVLLLGCVDGAAAHQVLTVDAIVAEVRQTTARYLDIEKARDDGFVQLSGMEPRHGYHFARVDAGSLISAALTGARLDLARPPMLLYVERGGAWQLAGVEYALPARPPTNPFPGAQWHEHEASCHYRDFRELPGGRASECPAKHPVSGERFVFWHPSFAVV